MSLDHAILGFLGYKPMSGYDLKKTMDLTVQHFWSADQSQIYRTLNRLADRELIEVEIVEQVDRPDRKVYSITQAGKDELGNWLAEPMPSIKQRNPGFIQVFFAAQLSDEEIISKLEQRAEVLRHQLAMLEDLPHFVEERSRKLDSARDAYFWQITLLAGVVDLRSQLEWLDIVLEDMKNGGVPTQDERLSHDIINQWPIAALGVKY